MDSLDSFPEEEAAQLQQMLDALVGRSVCKVLYWPAESSPREDGVHANYQIVELLFDDGQWLRLGNIGADIVSELRFEFTRDQDEPAGDDPECPRLDASTVKPWPAYRNRKVTRATLHWTWTRVYTPIAPWPGDDASPEAKEQWMSGPKGWSQPWYCPQDVELAFDSGQNLYISSGVLFEDKSHFYQLESSVSLFFEDELAERYSLGHFRGDPRTADKSI